MLDYDLKIHESAVLCAKRYFKVEAELLDILQKIEERKIFLKLGYSSLFQYAVDALKLTEAQAYSFINVARKAREIPELKEAVQKGSLTVSKAKRIIPVIKKENSSQWIQKAIELPQRVIEREVAALSNFPKIKEKIRPIAQKRSELRCGISLELENKIKRAQDVISQSSRSHCSLEQALEKAFEEFLERHDPVVKAKRILSKSKNLKHAARNLLTSRLVGAQNKRVPLPANLKHQIHFRDQGQCTYSQNKKRCEVKRWTEIHHKIPVSQGGENQLNNLFTLCSVHHRHIHEMG